MKDNIQSMTKPELRRLVKRIDGRIHVSGLVYEELRGRLLIWLENVIRAAVVFMNMDRLEPARIRVSHILAALKYKPGNNLTYHCM